MDGLARAQALATALGACRGVAEEELREHLMRVAIRRATIRRETIRRAEEELPEHPAQPAEDAAEEGAAEHELLLLRPASCMRA